MKSLNRLKIHRSIFSRYAIWIVILFGLFLRFVSINQSLWLDEATTALVAKMPLSDIFSKFMPGDFHPPLYYIFMRGWVLLFGNSEISLRVPSVIFGVATVYFVFLIAKKLFDKKTALIASALSATSGLLIYYSQEARMYAMAGMLVSVLFYLFLEKKWIPFSVCLVLLAMTDYTVLLVVPVFLIFGGRDFKKVVLSFIPTALVFAFWLPVFFKQVSGGTGVAGSEWWQILGTLSWKNLGLIPVKFVLGRISFDNGLVYAIVAGASVLLYSLLLGINIVRRPYKTTSCTSACTLVSGWLVIPVVLGIIISIKIPVLYYFRFLFCLPALYILAASGISKLQRFEFGIVLSVALLTNILSSGYYLLNPKFHREDWRGIATAVGSAPIVYPSSSQHEALIYYGKGENIVYYENFEGGVPEIWLSRYVWNIFDPGDSARIKVENLGYNKVQEINLNGVLFWKYVKY